MSTTTAPASGPEGAQPVLRVLTPTATPEEIAAVIAVLSALSTPQPPAPPTPRSEWAHPARAVRHGLTPGPGAWRASALPR